MQLFLLISFLRDFAQALLKTSPCCEKSKTPIVLTRLASACPPSPRRRQGAYFDTSDGLSCVALSTAQIPSILRTRSPRHFPLVPKIRNRRHSNSLHPFPAHLPGTHPGASRFTLSPLSHFPWVHSTLSHLRTGSEELRSITVNLISSAHGACIPSPAVFEYYHQPNRHRKRQADSEERDEEG